MIIVDGILSIWDRICSVVDACGLVLRLQTWRSITNERSEAQLKPNKELKHESRKHADRLDRFVVLSSDGYIKKSIINNK